MTRASSASGDTITYPSYDNALLLTQVANVLARNEATISQHSYPALDAVGHRPQVNEVLPTQLGPPGLTAVVQTSYGYDRLSRLTSVNNGATTYTYGPVGNRLSKNGTSSTYDRADRIQNVGSTTYTVDSSGNLVARGSDSFTYDQANRLTSATLSGTTSTYVYDGDGKRTRKTVGTTMTNYVYDADTALPNVLADGTLKYVYALGLTYAVDASGNVQVYHTDGLGSVRAITDGSGNVIPTYQTDEFGVPTQTQGTNGQPFQYTGQQRDAETGLYYLRARIYDPSSGRFLSRDPLRGAIVAPQTLNPYAYVGNTPTTRTDPSGTGVGPLLALCVALLGDPALIAGGGSDQRGRRPTPPGATDVRGCQCEPQAEAAR